MLRVSDLILMGRTKSQYILTRRHKQTIQGKNKLRSSSWWEQEVKGKKPLAVCKRCHAVYFDEHWHTSSKLYEAYKGKPGVREELCPEDTWIKAGFHGIVNYEGEVLLKNLTDLEFKADVIRQARNIGARALKRDPEDQIIKIEDRGETVRLTTTENQLAVSIGKQISQAYKGGKLEIKWSREDAPARVIWSAPKSKIKR